MDSLPNINPPYSEEVEQAVLGSLLSSPEAYADVEDSLSADLFFNPTHRLIFLAIKETVNTGYPVDSLHVNEALKRQGVDNFGGLVYLQDLVFHSGHRVGQIDSLIRNLQELLNLRRLHLACVSTIGEITAPQGLSPDEVASRAEQRVLDATESASSSKESFQAPEETSEQVLTALVETMQNGAGYVSGIRTGFPNLDALTAGLHRGDLVIVAGRPSMGKTTLAVNIAENVGFNEGLPVLVFSLEMSAVQLSQRILSARAGINSNQLRRGSLSDQETRRLIEASNEYHKSQIYIDSTTSLRVHELGARARRMKRQLGGLGLIVVDYIQLMEASKSRDNRTLELGEISRGLKTLAKELDVPVIALSQLSRSVESRQDKRPMMSDLRESGAIEQDADVILFVYRDVVYDPQTPIKNLAELIVAKQRNGAIGSVRLSFNGSTTRFTAYSGV